VKATNKSPYSKSSHRRHHEDADLEDKVLLGLVDGGWTWELDPRDESDGSAILEQFPGNSLQALKSRVARIKAKTMQWSQQDV
jgi:hypothetical protein